MPNLTHHHTPSGLVTRYTNPDGHTEWAVDGEQVSVAYAATLLANATEKAVMAEHLRAFYVNRDDGYTWLYHSPDPTDDTGHPVGIEIEGGTTLADLYTAAIDHECEEA